MSRIKFFIVAAAIVALVVGVVLLTRHRQVWKPPQELVKLANETSASFRSAPTARADDHAALLDAFGSADFFYNADYDDADANSAAHNAADGEALNDTQRSSLLETLAQIIELRWRADADAYAAWMRSRGYTLKDVDRDAPHGLHYVYVFRHRAGRDLSPADTPWDIFKLTFEAELAHHKGGVTHPVGVVSGPGAMEIWVGRLRQSDGIDKLFLPILMSKMKEAAQSDRSDFSKIRWSLGQEYAGWPHWSPPISYDEIIARDGQVLFARVNSVIRTRKRGSIPTTFRLYYDPRTDLWHLFSMSYVNTYKMALGLGPEF